MFKLVSEDRQRKRTVLQIIRKSVPISMANLLFICFIHDIQKQYKRLLSSQHHCCYLVIPVLLTWQAFDAVACRNNKIYFFFTNIVAVSATK